MRIFKYPILFGQITKLPRNHQVLDIQLQHGKLFMWAEILPGAPEDLFIFELVVTGGIAPATGTYLKTVQLDGGHFVGHIYRLKAKENPHA